MAMPDLGDRGNVNGPQPIGKVIEPPAAMYDAATRFMRALVEGDKVAALAMTDQQARDQVAAIADSIKAGAYNRTEFFGKARVVKHYFVKARLLGSDGSIGVVQVRMGTDDDGAWKVREAVNLTGVKSGWTK
jgi:hypothetical protein